MLYIDVAAGEALTENHVGGRLSLLKLHMPISTIQDIIDKRTCQAVMGSGEVRIRDIHGIILQVVAASGHPPCCKPVCSSAIVQAFCSSMIRGPAYAMQVSMTDHASSCWCEQAHYEKGESLGVGRAVQ